MCKKAYNLVLDNIVIFLIQWVRFSSLTTPNPLKNTKKINKRGCDKIFYCTLQWLRVSSLSPSQKTGLNFKNCQSQAKYTPNKGYGLKSMEGGY